MLSKKGIIYKHKNMNITPYSRWRFILISVGTCQNHLQGLLYLCVQKKAYYVYLFQSFWRR